MKKVKKWRRRRARISPPLLLPRPTTKVKTTEEVSRSAAAAAALCKSQFTLSVYGCTGADEESAKVIPIYKAKVV